MSGEVCNEIEGVTHGSCSIFSPSFLMHLMTSGVCMLLVGLICVCATNLLVLKYNTKMHNEDSGSR